MKNLISIITIALLFLSALTAEAMPALDGRPEPARPAGVNQPSHQIVNRDNPNLEGEWNCLIILIDFPDYPWDKADDSNFVNDDGLYTSEHFNQMLFSEGTYRHPGSASNYTGSMHDYYSEISRGDFTTNGVATRWYRAPHPYSYYCNADGEAGTDDDNGFGEYPNNAQGLVDDAISMADATVNFSDYDNNDDGMVDALFVVHSGPGAEAIPGDAGANYIWSHKWQTPGQQLDNVFIGEYTIEPEDGSVGVFCHEFGHALGLPDLYDTDGSSEGVGEWCLMGAGGWCSRPGDPPGTSPAHMCAWAKLQLDWVTVHFIDGALPNAHIEPVETSGEVYRIWRGGNLDNEYFLVENRRRIGFDAGLTRRQINYDFPAPEGLLILHVDDSQMSNEDENHRWVDVLEASGLHFEGRYVENLDGARGRPADMDLINANRGDDGDLWPGYEEVSENRELWQGDRSKNSFSFASIPSSNDYNGEPTFVSVTNMHFADQTIICNFDIAEPDAPVLLAGEVEFSDEDEGNGDGFFEPGESASINIHIRNIGRQDATDVALDAEYAGDLGVTIEPEGFVAYPDIASQSDEAGETPFRVTLPADAPEYGTILINCTVQSNDTLTFNFQVSVDVRPPHEWTKFPENPVLHGSEGAWDASGVLGIATLFEADTLKLWYIGGIAEDSAGQMGIGYAWSLDGGQSFTKRDEPVITADDLPDWAATGVSGMAVMQNGDSYLMMLLGTDADDNTTIGRALSQDGISWNIDADPSIRPANWVQSIFPFGNLTLFYDGLVYHCGFSGTTDIGTSALGTAYTNDFVHWQVAPRAVLLPTMNGEDFDGFVCFSPDVMVQGDGAQLLYAGFNMDIVGRLGLVDVGPDLSITRHRGLEPGGAILVADQDGWEAGSMMFGGRMFMWRNQKRILYVAVGENSGSIGLAIEGEQMAAPIESDHPATLPASVLLKSAYPNPFNGTTVVNFTLPRASDVKLALYDLAGRKVVERQIGLQEAGEHHIAFEATNEGGMISSGFYFLSVESTFGSARQGVILLK